MRKTYSINPGVISKQKVPGYLLWFLAIIISIPYTSLNGTPVPQDNPQASEGQETTTGKTTPPTTQPEGNVETNTNKKDQTGTKNDELQLSAFSLKQNYWLQPGEFRSVYFIDKTIKPEDVQEVNIFFSKDITGDENKNTKLLKVNRIQLSYQGMESENILRIVMHVPAWKGKFDNYLSPSFFEGMLETHKCWLFVKCKLKNGRELSDVFRVLIPNPFWAMATAFFYVLLITVVTWYFINGLRRKREQPPVSIWKVPLHLANTPQNRFNLSLVQVVIWTYVFLFGLFYVFRMTGAILDVTPQVLLLLGIGGATATAAKVQTAVRMQSIPWRYWEFIKSDRTPLLSDLITTPEGIPSIVKFQMLFFTIIIAGKVGWDIVNTHNFPVISEGMITLMGLSSAVFLGNDMTNEVSKTDLQQSIDNLDTKMAGPGIPDPAKDPDVQKFKALVDAYLR